MSTDAQPQTRLVSDIVSSILPSHRSSLGLFAVLVLLIPMPLVGSGHIFGVKGFTIWVAVSIAWCMAAGLIITGLPLWESRKALGDIFRGMYRDLCRKRA